MEPLRSSTWIENGTAHDKGERSAHPFAARVLRETIATTTTAASAIAEAATATVHKVVELATRHGPDISTHESPAAVACTMDAADVLQKLRSDPLSGLSREEYGLNEMEGGEKTPLWLKFLEQFKDPLILLLLGSSVVSVIVGNYDDAMSISAAVVIVVSVGFVQEYRSEQTLEALKTLVPPHCHCIREGHVHALLASELVPGDIVQLAMGDRVPADARLVEAADLSTDESMLTGETTPNAKYTRAVDPARLHSPHAATIHASDGSDGPVSVLVPMAERHNIVYMGTLVTRGSGRAVVVGTGVRSEFGRVYAMMDEVEDRRTPLQEKMRELGHKLSVFSFAVISAIVAWGWFKGGSFIEMFTVGVSLAVAAIPEGLPIVVTVTLALGVMRMARRNAIVRKLPGVESLGAVRIVCVDKTGTLTCNEMTVTRIFTPSLEAVAEVSGNGYVVGSGGVFVNGIRTDATSHPQARARLGRRLLPEAAAAPRAGAHGVVWGLGLGMAMQVAAALAAGAVCCDAQVQDDGTVIGPATEAALLVAAVKMGMGDPRQVWERVQEIPFNSDSKCMEVVCRPKAAALEPAARASAALGGRDNSAPTPSTSGRLGSGYQERKSIGGADALPAVAAAHVSPRFEASRPVDGRDAAGSAEKMEGGAGSLPSRIGGRPNGPPWSPPGAHVYLAAGGVPMPRPGGHDERMWFVKGALESVLDRCEYVYSAFQGGELAPLTRVERERTTRAASTMARAGGLRVIATATGWDPNRLVFCGMLGLMDPPRDRGVGSSSSCASVHDAVARLHGAGVSVVMITGDSRDTAESIAQSLGIFDPARHISMSGHEVEQLVPGQLDSRVMQARVFYRAAPNHKMKIVAAFQATGNVVAMTGDGVNDAPALRLADIGIAMGRSGTDVCKEAADMILLDDDFATIMAAVEEGKCIYYNIKNFLRFQLSTSIAALALISISTFMGYPNPLNAMQILWINIIMDGPPAQSLGVEPVDHDVMRKPPRDPNAPIITMELVRRVLFAATVIVSGTLYVYIHEMEDGVVTARDNTMSFTTFVMFDMFNALSCRSEDKSVFEIGLATNRAFLFAMGASLVGQLAVIYTPLLQQVFQTEPLEMADLAFIVLLASSVWVLDEIRKVIWSTRRGSRTINRFARRGTQRKNSNMV